ncbi:MAG: hypothetical protein ACKVUS_06155 [Saprospiraceae bacterium]
MIGSYFQAEKLGGQIALAIGIVACSVGGGVLLGAGAPFYTGLAIPLVLIGFAQIMVGATVARRSDLQAEDLEKLLADSPAEFCAQEAPRMAAVMRNFVLIKWVEIALIAVGLILIFLNQELNFPKGLGAGLFAQSALMLVFDFFAERRGWAYAAFVQNQ